MFIIVCCMADVHNQITDYEWGKEKQVAVRCDNRPDPPVDEELLEEIFYKADLPECKLLLILNDTEDPDDSLFRKKRGFTIARKDLPYFLLPVVAYKEYEVLGNHNMNAGRWDYLVYIPKETVEQSLKYKYCFAFVLWHELEHMNIMVANLQFHRFASWVKDRLVDDKRALTWYDFALEKHCNIQAKRRTTDAYPERFIEQLQELIDDDVRQKEVWQHVICLEYRPEDESPIEGIHRKIVRQVEKALTNNFLWAEWQKEHEDQRKYASTFKLGDFLYQR